MFSSFTCLMFLISIVGPNGIWISNLVPIEHTFKSLSYQAKRCYVLNGLSDQVITKLKSSLGDCTGPSSTFPLLPPSLRTYFVLGPSSVATLKFWINFSWLIVNVQRNFATYILFILSSSFLVFDLI